MVRRVSVAVLVLLSFVLSGAAFMGSGGSGSAPARAGITDNGGNFGSDVPCFEVPDQFATTCFANTIVEDTSASGETLRRVASSDTALVRFNAQGKSPLANLGQLGSVYGLAYDDGALSGTRQLFIAAFAKRLTSYGPGGPGAIYRYDLNSGAISTFAQVPGTTNRHIPGDPNDEQMAAWVGKSSLGDLELAPGGRTLFALNLDTRQVEQYNVLTGGRIGPISLNLGLISSDPAVQADLRPFALEFQPGDTPLSPSLYIGLVDSGERNPNGVIPTAYVMRQVLGGGQSLVLTQPLNIPAINSRFQDGVNAGQPGWRSWVNIGKSALYPMPILSDIQFSRDGQIMLLGLRDRNGDVFMEDTNNSWWRVQAQGDTLVYRSNGSSWTLQQRNGVPTTTDFFRDNYVGSPSTAHVENSMGALATTLGGMTSGGLTEYLVTTAITPLTGGTAGANWYAANPDAYDRITALELIPEGDAWKSATLGDLENLCAVAYIGDRVWRDDNGNGLQDAGEAGIGGVRVLLTDSNGTPVASATTDSTGLYQFAIRPNISGYQLVLDSSNFAPGQPLFDLILSPQDRGGSDAIDSDANQISRAIGVPAQTRDAYNMAFDFGLMRGTFANGEVGDYVWNDLNANGMQDAGEPGISGLTVTLIDIATNTIVGTQTTSSGGRYLFTNVVPGTYQVAFTPPAGILASPRDAGGNDATDSDADASTGWRTPPVTVIADTVNDTLDLGLVFSGNVKITKTGPATAPVGSQVTYTLAYGNDGPAAAQNVTVQDTFPTGLVFSSASPAPTSVSGNVLTWNPGTLNAGASGSISVVFTVATDAPVSGDNRASITTTTNETGPGPTDNSTTITTRFTRPNLAVTKTGPATARTTADITYTLSYRNTGTADATNARLVDTLPAGLEFVSANPTPTRVSGQDITWDLGTLAPDASGSITVVARSFADARGDVVNTVTITTPAPGDPPGDNTTTVTTTLQQPDLRIDKTDNQIQSQPGDTVTYQITVRNTGTADATGVVITEQPPTWAIVPAGAWTAQPNGMYTLRIGTVAAGQSMTRAFTLTIPNPLPAGVTHITNIAVTTDDGSGGDDPTPGDNTTTDTNTVPSGTVGDMVWYDKDGNGTQNAGEGGFGGLMVQLLDPQTDQVLATTTTTPDGKYSFTGLRFGSYAVALDASTTTTGPLIGYRYTTAPTPVGSISMATPTNMTFDLGLNNPGSTDVVLGYLRVERVETGTVAVAWRTLEEINTTRFLVQRSLVPDRASAVTIAIVTAKGTQGGSYRVTDGTAPGGAYYWLVELERGGKQTVYGPLTQQAPLPHYPVSHTAIFLPLIGR